jgi:hypothetical protein
MALKGYHYTSKGSDFDSNNTPLERFTFKSDIVNQQYIVEILVLKHDIYVAQFYLKNHRLSGKRFNLLLDNPIEKNNRHVLYVLNTITNICLDIYAKNPNASFAFMGAPTSKESNPKKNKANINPDRTIKNTKRHRIYSLYVKRYFSPEKFTHIVFNDSSCYLLKNNSNAKLDVSLSNDYHNELIKTKMSIN